MEGSFSLTPVPQPEHDPGKGPAKGSSPAARPRRGRPQLAVNANGVHLAAYFQVFVLFRFLVEMFGPVYPPVYPCVQYP